MLTVSRKVSKMINIDPDMRTREASIPQIGSHVWKIRAAIPRLANRKPRWEPRNSSDQGPAVWGPNFLSRFIRYY